MYEARADKKHDFLAEIKLKKTLQEIYPGMDLAILARDDSSLLPSVETKFGKCPVGAFGSYQFTHTEANFVPFIDISTVPREANISASELVQPRVQHLNMYYLIRWIVPRKLFSFPLWLMKQ